MDNLKLLSLSTAENGCSLAVFDGESLLFEEYWMSRKTHSTRLLSMIKHMLEKRTSLLLGDMDAFVAAKGPGSFTGLRIGISIIQGFSYAMEKPAYGVSSLDGVGYRFSYTDQPICVMMDAKRNEVYTATYRFKKGRLISKSQESVANPIDVLRVAKPNTLFAGSGSKVYQEIIQEHSENPLFSKEYDDFVNAKAMIQSLFGNEDFLYSPESILIPSYIRKSDAELQFAEK